MKQELYICSMNEYDAIMVYFKNRNISGKTIFLRTTTIGGRFELAY